MSALDHARQWWAANRDSVAAALPLTIGPRTYTPRYPALTDQRLTVADQYPPQIAEKEIFRDLRTLAKWLASTQRPLAGPGRRVYPLACCDGNPGRR